MIEAPSRPSERGRAYRRDGFVVEQADSKPARLVKYEASPCFVREGVPLREQQLEAFKPSGDGRQVEVMYRGRSARSTTTRVGCIRAAGA